MCVWLYDMPRETQTFSLPFIFKQPLFLDTLNEISFQKSIKGHCGFGYIGYVLTFVYCHVHNDLHVAPVHNQCFTSLEAVMRLNKEIMFLHVEVPETARCQESTILFHSIFWTL